MPVSLLAPAHDEETTIVENVRSMLALSYPLFEAIVINDGSRDGTAAAVIEAFDMRPSRRVFEQLVPHAPIRGIYGSPRYPRLLLIDKENGGKADALNAGINLSRSPLVRSMMVSRVAVCSVASSRPRWRINVGTCQVPARAKTAKRSAQRRPS